MKNVKMVVFDMDGTLADTYAVNDWKKLLRAESPFPYAHAAPLVNREELAKLMQELRNIGIEFRVVTWLSKNSSEDFKNLARFVKRSWLNGDMEYFLKGEHCGVNIMPDHFHAVQYGTPKASVIRRYVPEDGEAIIFDDDPEVRKSWAYGTAYDPAECDILEVLRSLLN